jgi:hypothetical protein
LNNVILCRIDVIHVGFEVLTVVAVKRIIFWDVMPCIPVDVHGCFGGMYCLHLQG